MVVQRTRRVVGVALTAAAGAHANIFWTTLARGASFAIPLVSARVFGATPETDAFFLGLGAVTFFVSVGGVVLEQAIVPHSASLESGGLAVVQWLWRLARWASVLGLVLAAVAAVSIKVAAALQPRAEIRVLLGSVQIAGIALVPGLVVLGSLGAGVLTGRGRYPLVCGGMALRAVGIVATMIGRPFGSTLPDLTMAFLAGESARTLYNLVAASRTLRSMSEGPSGGAGPPPVLSIWNTTWPIAASMAAAALSPVVDRIVAAGVVLGGVSLVEYGEKAYFAIVGTVIAGLQVTVFTRWSRLQRVDRPLLWKELRALALIGVSAAVVVAPVAYAVGPLMARLVVGGAFLSAHTQVGRLIGFYLVAVLPYAVGGFAVRALISIDATRPLVWLGIVKVVVNLIGDVLLSRAFGLSGIAMATVAAESLVTVIAVATARVRLAEKALR